MLMGNMLIIFNRLQPEANIHIDIPVGSDEIILKVFTDVISNTYWMATSINLYEIIVNDELDGVCQIYLAKKDYSNALRYAQVQFCLL